MMWRKAGFEESLVSPAKRDQNEMGGDSKNEMLLLLLLLLLLADLPKFENETNHVGKAPKLEKRD